MAGQGTVALEILQQLAQATAAGGGTAGTHLAAGSSGGSSRAGGGEEAGVSGSQADLTVYVPVGGGGLIGGMAAVRATSCVAHGAACMTRSVPLLARDAQDCMHRGGESAAPLPMRGACDRMPPPARPCAACCQVFKHALGARVRVVGCQPAASDVMRQSVLAGRIVDAPSGDTLSDATAGGIEEGAITLEPCMAAVDEWVTLSEGEIADAMLSMLHHHSKLVEGAAACALAAFWRQRRQLAGRRAVVLCCGGNVATGALARVLAEGRVLHADSDQAATVT